MSTVIIGEPNHLLRIDQVWIVVSTDENGNEGVVAGPMPGIPGMLAPLIAADEARLPWVRDQARRMALISGERLKLIRLHSRTDVETFEPQAGGRQ